MRFLMLVCRDEAIELTPEERASMGSHVAEWVSEMEMRRVRLLGEVLAPGSPNILRREMTWPVSHLSRDTGHAGS